MTAHLGIQAQRLFGHQTGVGRYLESILEVWTRDSIAGRFLFDRVTLYTRDPLPDDLLPCSPVFVNQVVPSHLPPFLWEHWVLPRRITIPNVFFCPSNVVPLGYRGRTVVTIHDMLAALRPEDFPLRGRLIQRPLYRSSARHADQVLTDAAATVPAIIEHYRVPAPRIHAVPLAAHTRFAREPQDHDAAVAGKFGLAGIPYVLFVGKLSRRRHIPELIAAFGRVRARLPHRLFIVGPNQLHLPVEELVRRHGVEDRVVYAGYVSDRDLPSLYRLADVFVYPSEMEGFGLPVLEAMQSGTPVLTLNRPTLSEVGGEAAYYVDEATADTLADALFTLLTDPAQRARRVAAGLDRARAFSWEVTARRTLEVLLLAAGRSFSSSDGVISDARGDRRSR